ncbi:MAG: glucans biosynthesis glucosyltransferase MdoH [Planctomycetota bacterium]
MNAHQPEPGGQPAPRFDPAVIFSRAGLVLASLASTYVAAVAFGHLVFRDGLGPGSVLLWLLFVVLFMWVAQGFWTATIGLLHMLRSSPTSIVPLRREPTPRLAVADLPRSAVVMPIYNEDPVRVFAGVEAMIRSVAQTGYGDAFDWHILSDTRDPAVWIEEQMQAQALRDAVGDSVRLYYRRRHRNTARKSGNLEEWATRFGTGYECMLVLDADSVMDGDTVVEMAHRMAHEPNVGILQAPPTPVGRTSLFARCQQFAARVYGEVFTTGFSVWTHQDGNYYGHNALIRVRPFLEHCGLPILPGKPPLGGEILSHDFVEAALMRKAGYTVKIAYDLTGSYEECPTSLLDFAQRDQRWCQGNLQHTRLVVTRGYHPLSRVHLAMGVMSYVASPLWLIFMLVSLIVVATKRWAPDPTAIGGVASPLDPMSPALVGFLLFAAVMLMLLIPKLYAVCLLLQRPTLLRAHGGELATVGSAIIEVFVSVLIAPLMMLYHSRFVLTTLRGRTVNWSKQNRDECELGWAEAWEDHRGHTLIGVLAVGGVWLAAPSLLLWSLPVLAGLIFAVPIAKLMSSAAVGAWLREHRLLLIPEETIRPRVLQRFSQALRRTAALRGRAADVDPRDRVIADPALLQLHLDILADNDEPRPLPEDFDLAVATEQAVNHGIADLPRDAQNAILSSPDSLRRLHRYAWATWPADTLANIARQPLATLLRHHPMADADAAPAAPATSSAPVPLSRPGVLSAGA